MDAHRATRTTAQPTADRATGYKRWLDRGVELSEDVLYVAIAAVLLVVALVLIGQAALALWGLPEAEGPEAVALEVLDLLLLVFIVVELLFAVRATVTRRELVAEPFLLVGIIASIKEIVVLSVKAADDAGSKTFKDQMLQVGLLGALVLLLAVSAWLLRRKEREPQEAQGSAPGERTPVDDSADAPVVRPV